MPAKRQPAKAQDSAASAGSGSKGANKGKAKSKEAKFDSAGSKKPIKSKVKRSADESDNASAGSTSPTSAASEDSILDPIDDDAQEQSASSSGSGSGKRAGKAKSKGTAEEVASAANNASASELFDSDALNAEIEGWNSERVKMELPTGLPSGAFWSTDSKLNVSAAKPFNLMPKKVDFVIVVVNENELWAARHFVHVDEIFTDQQSGLEFNHGTLIHDPAIRMLLVQQPRAGSDYSMTAAHRVFSTTQFRAIVGIGVAMGWTPFKHRLYDVLFSSSFLGYEEKKKTDKEVENRSALMPVDDAFVTSVKTYKDWDFSIGGHDLQQVNAVTDDAAAELGHHLKLEESLPKPSTTRAGKVQHHVGHMFSGNTLAGGFDARDEFTSQWQVQQDKVNGTDVIGVEMEGRGMLRIAQVRRVPAFIIKSVSDYGFNKLEQTGVKKQFHQRRAAYTAFSFFASIVTKRNWKSLSYSPAPAMIGQNPYAQLGVNIYTTAVVTRESEHNKEVAAVVFSHKAREKSLATVRASSEYQALSMKLTQIRQEYADVSAQAKAMTAKQTKAKQEMSRLQRQIQQLEEKGTNEKLRETIRAAEAKLIAVWKAPNRGISSPFNSKTLKMEIPDGDRTAKATVKLQLDAPASVSSLKVSDLKQVLTFEAFSEIVPLTERKIKSMKVVCEFADDSTSGQKRKRGAKSSKSAVEHESGGDGTVHESGGDDGTDGAPEVEPEAEGDEHSASDETTERPSKLPKTKA